MRKAALEKLWPRLLVVDGGPLVDDAHACCVVYQLVLCSSSMGEEEMTYAVDDLRMA